MAFAQLPVRFLMLMFAVFLPSTTMKTPNSLRTVVVCEDAVAEFDCTSYPGIIDVYDVEFVKENAYACENGNKTDQCVASGEEEKNLKSALGKSCNGKRICRIHMTDGLYDDIKIPCRDIGIKIRIQLIYDCIFSPTAPSSEDSNSTWLTTTTAEPVNEAAKTTGTASEAVTSNSETPLTTASEAVANTTGTPSTTSEAIATTTGKPTKKWIRRRPTTCNITKEHHFIVESNAPACDSAVRMVVFILSFQWLVKKL